MPAAALCDVSSQTSLAVFSLLSHAFQEDSLDLFVQLVQKDMGEGRLAGLSGVPALDGAPAGKGAEGVDLENETYLRKVRAVESEDAFGEV